MDIPARRAWVEINLDAIRHNIATLRSLVPPKTKFLAVVKANAYGHGAVEVANTALECGASFLAVATVDEGVELREAGIVAPILVLSEPSPAYIPDVLHYQLSTTACTAEYIMALGGLALEADVIAPIHLAIDTGMNRIGVHPLDAVGFATSIQHYRSLKIEGTFTHFATADIPGDISFRMQVKRFTEAIDALRAADIDPGIVHCANSPSIILHPEVAFDMVRGGIAMYGLHPDKSTYGHVVLEPAMEVYAAATFVKTPSAREGVSYGMTYHTSGSEVIATFPIGYADGLHRALSGKMDVLYNGKRYHQVGRICMDQMMVSFANNRLSLESLHEKEIEQNDVVCIVGAQGKERITLDELADLTGTINYELACSLGSMRLPRLYRG